MDYSQMSLSSLASNLSDLYLKRAEAGLQERQINQDIEQRKIEVTPVDIKSLGANEAERKNALERIYQTDAALADLETELKDTHEIAARVEAQIIAVEAQRRACEWYIRMELVHALQGSMDRSDYDPAGDEAIDAGMQAEVDAAVSGKAASVYYETISTIPVPKENQASEEEIPF